MRGGVPADIGPLIPKPASHDTGGMKTTLHIFKAGTHTAMSGATLAFTEADLTAMVNVYDPAVYQAPIVIGHPSTNDPAYGWVRALSTDAGQLYAEPEQVDPDFAELVNAGRYKKISISVYQPDSPSNPMPGNYYLRHVGFLGAQAPAIKGLKPASFAATDAGVIEFSDWGMDSSASLWRKLREWLLTKFGQEDADQVVPDWQIETIREAARQDVDPSPATSYQEQAGGNPSQEANTVTPEQKAALEAENTALKARLAEVEACAQQQQMQQRRSEFGEFIGDLVRAGRVLPADQTALTGLLCYAAGDASDAVDFGEGTDPAEWLKGFLTRLPVQVDYGEHTDTAAAEFSADFAAPRGFRVSTDALDLHNRAVAFQEQHPGTDYLTAVKILEKQS